MVIRIRKIDNGTLTITKIYFRKREVILILPQQSS